MVAQNLYRHRVELDVSFARIRFGRFGIGAVRTSTNCLTHYEEAGVGGRGHPIAKPAATTPSTEVRNHAVIRPRRSTLGAFLEALPPDVTAVELEGWRIVRA
jgi:hypothetical protein